MLLTASFRHSDLSSSVFFRRASSNASLRAFSAANMSLSAARFDSNSSGVSAIFKACCMNIYLKIVVYTVYVGIHLLFRHV